MYKVDCRASSGGPKAIPRAIPAKKSGFHTIEDANEHAEKMSIVWPEFYWVVSIQGSNIEISRFKNGVVPGPSLIFNDTAREVVHEHRGVVNESNDIPETSSPVTEAGKDLRRYLLEDGTETIDIIFAMGFGREFCLGNVIKYVSRSRHPVDQDPKDKVASVRNDLKKAKHYLEILLERMQA